MNLTFTQFLIEQSVADEIADKKSRIKSLRDRIGTQGESRGDNAELQKHQQDLRDLEARHKVETGETKSVEFVIPSKIASDVHSELHSLWKNTSAGKIPWGTFHHKDDDKTVVRFHGYTPGATSGKEGGKPVEQLIKYVKKHEVK